MFAHRSKLEWCICGGHWCDNLSKREAEEWCVSFNVLQEIEKCVVVKSQSINQRSISLLFQGQYDVHRETF